ncbi:hypothetical protein C8R45DRAFT_120581 [Mycena sanguinolenta]|nr:hypothetical protein C8R45DRAFT_120581 [Mycena sanguinolenta]
MSMDSTLQENCTEGCSVVSASMSRGTTPYLHILATELWLACWTLCSRRQLRRLTLVCKLFRDICHPLIFQHQTIDAQREPFTEDNWTRRLRGRHRAAVRLDALAGSAHVGSVHSWKFVPGIYVLSESSTIPHSELVHTTYARLLKTFSTTLGLYHNLRSLHVEALVIDAPFRQILSNLSRLENLALCSCDIVARDGFVMSLRSFTISAQESTVWHIVMVPREPLRIVAPDSLHTLHLDAPGETASLLTAFGRARFPHLVVLSLQHLSDLDMFLAFLAQCPGLAVLKIATVHPDIIASPPKYTLPRDTTPALRNLTIRGEMLGFFSLNRPIDTVTILNERRSFWRRLLEARIRPLATPVEYFTPAVLNDLLKTSVPLLSLSIPETSPTLELLNSITSLFPQLKDFSIHIKQPSIGHSTSGDAGLGSRGGSVDNQCPVLCDADAFDDIPEDDLSDAEQDNRPSIARVRVPKDLELSSSMDLHKTLQWVCSGAAVLPPAIEVLGFLCSADSFASNFPPAQEHQIIAALSRLYPHFCELEIGYSREPWTREGAVWSKAGTVSHLQVVV